MYYKFENNTLYLSNSQAGSDYKLYEGSWIPSSIKTDCTGITSGTTEKVVLPADSSNLFRGFTELTGMPSGLDFSQVVNASYMFTSCTKLDYGYLTSWNWSDKVTDMSYMFMNCTSLTDITLSNWNVSHVTNFSHMFYLTGSNSSSGNQYIRCRNWDTSSATDMSYMFSSCPNLNFVVGLESFNMSNVTTLDHFMYNDKKISLSVEPKNWDLSKCTNFSNAFYSCNSITELSFKNCKLNHEQPINFSYMFESCKNLTNIYVGTEPDWRSYAGTKDGMFKGCVKLPNYNSNYVSADKAYPDEWDGGYFTFISEWVTGTWYIKDSEGNWLESNIYHWLNSEGTYKEQTVYFRC